MPENTAITVSDVDAASIPLQRSKNIKVVVPAPDTAATPTQRIYCARVPISACTPGVAVAQVLHLARKNRSEGADVHLCNAYTLSLADQNAGYRFMLQNASLNLADGKSVAWMNKLVGVTAEGADRVRGNDLFLDVVEQGQFHGTRHYLLGSTPEVVEKLRDELLRRFPAASIVGVESPPFRPLTDDERAEQAARIRESGADIVWVGLGTPKQDRAAVELARDAGVVAVAIGAAFDFIAGNKPEAPTWMQHSGLEWVHRFSSEPRRLWRRYLFGNSRFVYAAYRYRRAQTHAKAVLETARQCRSAA
ncbi:WecB/TagA/CpsF family glycosyltransferase [Actinomycetospora sp. CA-084318]|uniref:WecB/TagA/CpsF family glycosyltransferase n=1 Tax=Actinomycetospora sp. CA-084318 TaxID=3239892 RepID=UPI003D979F77